MLLTHLGLEPLWAILLELLVTAAIVTIAGNRLSIYGDVLGEKTGLGGAWVGLMLLAAATSLPELVTGTGTTLWLRAPDLTFGNIFGSNCFNLLIIVVLDLMYRRQNLFLSLQQRHVFSASLGLLMMSVAVLPMLLRTGPGARGSFPGPYLDAAFSVLLALLYAWSVRAIFRFERHAMSQEAPTDPRYAHLTTKGTVIRFVMAAGCIVVSGLYLSKLADLLATTPIAGISLGRTFIGSLVLAAVTSLPELTVTVSAFRIGAKDMALGNLLGSNIFNVAIIPVLHPFYGPGLYADVQPVQAFTGLVAIFMTSVVIAALMYRPKRQVLGLGVQSVVLLASYVVGLVLLASGLVLKYAHPTRLFTRNSLSGQGLLHKFAWNEKLGQREGPIPSDMGARKGSATHDKEGSGHALYTGYRQESRSR